MKATEAAKLADVIQTEKFPRSLYQKYGDVWRDTDGDVVALDELRDDDYTPLVPLKQYAVGDVVKVWEAIGSGKCFEEGGVVRKVCGATAYFWTSKWSTDDASWPTTYLFRACTIVPDPSIPPKPTIADLEFGTMFKAMYLNKPEVCVMGNDGLFAAKDCGGLWTWSDRWTLTHIKNAAGEWEEV